MGCIEKPKAESPIEPKAESLKLKALLPLLSAFCFLP
jgi:hypothetical protein